MLVAHSPAAPYVSRAAPPIASLPALPQQSQQPRRAATLRLQLDDDGDDEYLGELEEELRAADGRSQEFFRLQRLRPSRPRRPRRRRRQIPEEQRRFTRESTQLDNLPTTLRGAYDDFLERPGQPLLLGSLALLFGAYLAPALSTIFGAAGFWEPTIAIGPCVVGELITRRYYSLPASERSQTVKLLNALKVGFYFGITLDALKLAG